MPRAGALHEHDDTSDADHTVFLHDVSWADYERLIGMRGDGSLPRISYLEGEVELMRPSKDHERIKSYIGRLLEAWCVDRGMEVSPFGSWTLNKKRLSTFDLTPYSKTEIALGDRMHGRAKRGQSTNDAMRIVRIGSHPDIHVFRRTDVTMRRKCVRTDD